MQLGEPVDPRVPWIRQVLDLKESRGIRSAGPKLESLRREARALGDEFRKGPKVEAVKTISLVTLPYPTTFAFNRAVPLPWPYVQLWHRCLLVQVLAEGELKNILFNPSDYEAAKATPFFAKILERAGERAGKLLAKESGQVDQQLDKLGISALDIDVIAFDHFHTQDVRPLLGTASLAARFPNAYLLAPRREWEDWGGLHPLQRPWFVAEGKDGVPASKVVLTEDDVSLGQGCLLLQTPGHTTGNQTLFVHGDRGVFGCSENGTSADSWSPMESRIPGLRNQASHYGHEVVLNSNTPELCAEQYTSMVVERQMADPVNGRPEFAQMFPSSEVTPWALAPGIRPSMVFGERDSGRLQTTRPAARESGVQPQVVA